MNLPPGFRRVAAPPVVLVVAESLLPTVSELRLLEPDGLDTLFERHARGATGRGATAVVPVPRSGAPLVVRRLLHGGLLGPLLGPWFLRLARPLRELAVTEALRLAGAPVPRAAFALGRRRHGVLWQLAVATWQEEGARDALAFLESEPGAEECLAAAAALGRAVRRFHDAGGRHGDLHVKNLLVCERDGRLAGVVIDLDKTRITPGLTPDERMSQIMRLFRSLVKRDVLDRVGPRGCARFFAAYCGDDRPLRRALWSRVDRELRVVAIHAWGYSRADAGPGAT